MKLTLDKWKAQDYEAFFRASQDDRLRANMTDTFPKTREECRQIVLSFSQSTDTTEYIRAIRIDGQIVGCIAAFFDSDRHGAELAYWLDSVYWNQGIMTQVVLLFIQRLLSLFDLRRVCARPFVSNRVSQRVLEKAGFHCQGLSGESGRKTFILNLDSKL